MKYLYKFHKYKEIIESSIDDDKKYLSKDDIERIEDIIYKKFKVNIDLDKLDDNNDDEKVVSESVVITGISIIALLPEIMKVIGDLSNFFKRKFGINLSKDDIYKIRCMNDAIYAYVNIYNGKVGHYKANKYDIKNCYKISEDLFNTNKEDEFNSFKNTDDVKKFIKNEIKTIKTKLDENFGTSFSKWMKEKSDELHKMFVSPIKLFLKGVSKISGKKSMLKDDNYIDKVSNIIYSILLLSIAGVGIIETLSHLNGVKDVGNVIIKGYEGGHKITDLMKMALSKIK